LKFEVAPEQVVLIIDGLVASEGEALLPPGDSIGSSFSVFRKNRLAESRSRFYGQKEIYRFPCLSMVLYKYSHLPRIDVGFVNPD